MNLILLLKGKGYLLFDLTISCDMKLLQTLSDNQLHLITANKKYDPVIINLDNS